MVILCQSQEQAHATLSAVKDWMTAWGLELHPTKTKVVDMSLESSYFDFLGYRFTCNRRNGKLDRWINPKSIAHLRERLRPYLQRYNARSLEGITAKLQPILKGCYEYFKHVRSPALAEIDGWVRMRLRSILRKRAKRKSRGRGADHQRWPNSFFTEHGLFSQAGAHERDCQSARRQTINWRAVCGRNACTVRRQE